MSVGRVRSGRMEQSASIGWIFVKFDIWVLFEKSAEEIQVPLKSDKNNGYFTWRPIYIGVCVCIYIYIYIYIYRSHLAEFFLEWQMFQTKVVEKIKTHILCSVIFFFEILALYEIMWKDFAEPDRPQMTIWRMRIACWVPNATNALSEYVIFIVLPLQQWLHECTSVLHCSTLPILMMFTYLVTIYNACK